MCRISPTAAPLAIVALLSGLFACSDPTSTTPGPAFLAVVGSLQLQGTVGSEVSPRPSVRVTDRRARGVSGVTVHFEIVSGGGAVSGADAVTDEDGKASVGSWTLGTLAGSNVLSAQVPGINSLQFTAIATADAPIRLGFATQPSDASVGSPIQPAVQVEVQDQYGNRVTSSTAEIEIDLASNPSGAELFGETTRAAQAGVATYSDLILNDLGSGYTFSASSSGLAGAVSVPFAVFLDVPPPVITAVTPPVISSSTVLTLTGANFNPNSAANLVTIHGQNAVVLSSSSTELRVVAPAFPVDCVETRNVWVQVETGGRTGFVSHPLRTAPQLSLAAGESAVLTTPQAARCVELPQTGASYRIGVYHLDENIYGGTSNPVISVQQYKLVARRSTVSQGEPIAAPAAQFSLSRLEPVRRAPGRDPIAAALERQRRKRSDSAHAKILDENWKILSAAAARARDDASDPAAARLSLAPATIAAVGSVGARTEFRYSFGGGCDSYVPLTARTAWVGEHAIIVEDTAGFGTPRLNGTLDGRYAQIGAEFDAKMWGIITSNFGNPLAVDVTMRAYGKVIMLFTPRLSEAQAFVYACDFLPRSIAPRSNEAPIFYARTPLVNGAGFEVDKPDGWQWVIRSTVIHETKHIASYAERLSRPGGGLSNVEQPWLEEGSARLAEELFARTFYGSVWKDNSGYQATLYCDYRPEFPECAGRPYTMPKHFDGLYDFLDGQLQTPFGSVTGDFSYYGSSWALQRWVIDHHAASESQFIAQLVQSHTASGASNLAARAGRAFEELYGEWILALAVDDYPGFTALDNRLAIPSWNTRDVFAGMHSETFQQSPFPKPHPLTPIAISYTSFDLEPRNLVNGGFSMYELSGTQSGSQLIAVQSPSGSPPSPNIRLAIVRVQ